MSDDDLDWEQPLQLSSIIALANLLSIGTKCTIPISSSISPGEVLGIARDTNNKSCRLQSLRLLANLSVFDNNDENLLYSKIGDEGLISLINLFERADLYTSRNIIRCLGHMSKDKNVADLLLNDEVWDKFIVVSEINDIEIQRRLSRTIANAAFNNSERLVEKTEVQTLLAKWIKSSDDYIRSNSIRARVSLATSNQKTPKYAEGIYLLHPTNASSDFDFDLIFIHGVNGHPFTTWANTPVAPDSTPLPEAAIDESKLVCWPKDWIPQDFPKARVITVGYDIFLSSWGGGNATPLHDQSQEILENLKLAGVGSRPFMFVTHSFGGLVAKQMLKLASQSPAHYSDISKNCRAVVFYATPHYGARLAEYAYTLEKVLRTTSAIYDLLPSSQHVDRLTRLFPKFAPNVATMCFGETEETCVLKNICLVIVDEASANPKFSGATHSFKLLKANHRGVCKPYDRNDEKYQLVRDFINSVIYGSSSSNSSSSSRLQHHIDSHHHQHQRVVID
ncbi:hypothetical protein SAMD00019534_109030 [Acytostelium subglobosum LB1]|uniref:hypothetical protein n=1 Tax=Acytostelium subglobosum LB1 TaxID=1410327 RepID=UPI0006450083|nr:hypothetical protein SAMD00019534_109030 [Acytostelium subglobosum LB1]GAM27727.1 hypothetical protein SAMD00019534_109030 [Acytostelium subglobosum LB1]|eukprot:XP_012749386.1 hypothetical protein SAMD00019534_109030 [Acytostelium subglobosum LB1]